MYYEKAKIVITDKETNTRILQEELAEYGSLSLIYNGADDMFQRFMTSELHFTILVDDASDAKYIHLLSSNEKRYKVDLISVDDNDNDLDNLWQGYLLPEQFSEPYINGKFFVSFIASDGLGQIKGFGYNLLNQFGRTSLTKLISDALLQTGLQLPIHIAPAIENAIEDVLVSEIEVDTTSFVKDSEDKSGVILDFYECLEHIIDFLGCKLFQYNSAWYLVGINRINEETLYLENYNYLGVFQNGSNLARNLQPVYFENSANVSIQLPFKSFIIEWDANKPDNIFPDDIVFQPVDIEYPLDGMLGISAQYWQPNFPDNITTINKVFLNDKQGDYFPPLEERIWKRQVGYVCHDTEVLTANVLNNYMDLANPIFVLPQETSFKCSGTLRFANNLTSGVDFTGSVLYEILLNDEVILSNVSTFPSYFNYDFEYSADGYNVNFSLEIDVIKIKEPGFINIKFYAFDTNIHTGHTFTIFSNLELKRKESDEKFTEVDVNAHSSLIKKLNTYYGSTLSDLSDRKVFVSDTVPYSGTTTTTPAFLQEVESQLYVEKSAGLAGLNWHLSLITADDYALLNEYKPYIKLKRSGAFINPDSYSVLDHDPTSSDTGFTGYYFGQLVTPATTIAYTSTDEIWINKPEEEVSVSIRNYLHAGWKPYNGSQATSSMEALGEVYGGSVATQRFLVEGDAFGVLNPLDILTFNFIGEKKFIPLSLKMDLTDGKSRVLMIEKI